MSDKPWSPTKLTIKEGMTIQEAQLQEWKTKLNAECFEALKVEAAKQNKKLPRGSTGWSVWRGSDMDNFIGNWKRKESK